MMELVLGIASAFWLGILTSISPCALATNIAAIGAVTAAAGRMIGDVGGWGNYIVSVIFFVVGLHLLDVVPMP